MMLQVNFKIRNVVLILGGILLFLMVSYVGVIIVERMTFDEPLLIELQKSYGLLFDFNLEANLPTDFSSVLLLLVSAILLLITLLKRQNGRQFVRQWAFLSALFLLMSIDEAAMIHEKVPYPVRLALGGINPRPLWIIAGGIVGISLILFFRKFAFHLPPRIRWMFLASAIIYGIGAVGIDMFSAWFILPNFERTDVIYRVMVLFEEAFEVVGVITFISALLLYLSNGKPTISFTLNLPSSTPEEPTLKTR